MSPASTAALPTSQKRIDANRQNAKKSTGPRTPEGKSRSRFNRLQHGLAATVAVLPGEDAAVFQARVDAMVETFAPKIRWRSICWSESRGPPGRSSAPLVPRPPGLGTTSATTPSSANNVRRKKPWRWGSGCCGTPAGRGSSSRTQPARDGSGNGGSPGRKTPPTPTIRRSWSFASSAPSRAAGGFWTAGPNCGRGWSRAKCGSHPISSNRSDSSASSRLTRLTTPTWP